MNVSDIQPVHDLRSALGYLAARGETVTEVTAPTDPDGVLIEDYIRRYRRLDASV